MKQFTNRAILFLLLLVGCADSKRKDQEQYSSNFTREQMDRMHWLNPPESAEIKEGSLRIMAVKGSDFFNNPEDGSISQSAPFLYETVDGDFVATAVVEPDFSAQWNAVALMVHIDSLNWIKFAFENSDATGPGIVSVVTRGTSDDANGAVLPDVPRLWLTLVRRKDIYAMHWSLDGEAYQMARLATMKHSADVKVGIEAQSPVGGQATHWIHGFKVENRSVTELRNYSE